MNNKRHNYLVIPVALLVALLMGSAEAQQRRGGGRSSTSTGQRGPAAQTRSMTQTRSRGQRGSMGQSGAAFSGGAFGGGTTAGGMLSSPETDSLYAMLDEEKLAHDVYVTLARTSGRPIFRTIAGAESQHINALRQLALRYNIAAPAASNAVGQFSNPQVRELYLELVASGSRSSLDAVKVGAKIEEMDIADLNAAIATSTQGDVRRVLENLQRGSRNHLRAFTRQMRDLGGTYDPEYLSKTEFERIANSRNERGGMGRGQQGGQGQRMMGQGQGQRMMGQGQGQGMLGQGQVQERDRDGQRQAEQGHRYGQSGQGQAGQGQRYSYRYGQSGQGQTGRQGGRSNGGGGRGR